MDLNNNPWENTESYVDLTVPFRRQFFCAIPLELLVSTGLFISYI